MLSKSDFTTALDCPKKLWLSRHLPELKEAIAPTALRRMRIGTEVGLLAKRRFPSGVTIPVWELGNEAAAAKTEELMATGQDVLFEATFLQDDLVARVDVLKREESGWRIIEVKATTKYKKPGHLLDVAFQASLFARCGHPLSGASLMHIDTNYVWDGGDWHVDNLFKIEEITDDVAKILPQIPDQATSFLNLINQAEYPPFDGEAPYYDPVIHSSCKGCEFAKHCTPRVPADHIHYLGLHHSRSKKLLADGIRAIGGVPKDLKLSDTERLRYQAFVTEKPAVSGDLDSRLAEIQYPAHLIDFETLRPDLPLFAGHSPFLMLPFQWSCHTLNAAPDWSVTDQSIGHTEFLHQHRSDPREAFIQSLLAQISTGGSILHYHDFEKQVINEMVKDRVPGADQVQAMFDRFIDLRKILEDCYADAKFLGKTSIKNVLPVVAPTLSYSGLNIQNGDQAQVAYASMLAGELGNDQAKQLFADLLEYCKLDTWAMVEILKALSAVA